MTADQLTDYREIDEEQSIDDLYLIFHLDQEDYGIGIGNVIEIVGKQNITRVPNMPHYVKGVINLRGQVIPVIDVRTRFGLPFREYDDRTCAIVISVDNVQFGLIVDVVDEVITIDPGHISPAPMVTEAHTAAFIRGMGRIGNNDRVKILLDVRRLFHENELEQMASTLPK
jgi:purine-binding chemotaxis protein CheW